jgi:hypothetical protein
MDRNQTPSKSSIVLSTEEAARRAAPGRLTKGVTSADPSGAKGWTPVGSGSKAAMAGQAEHEMRRAKPDLVAKRERAGK